jgi:hypothetical protein
MFYKSPQYSKSKIYLYILSVAPCALYVLASVALLVLSIGSYIYHLTFALLAYQHILDGYIFKNQKRMKKNDHHLR